jgi:DNA-binding PadR family transcriptional regulator
MHKGFRLGRKEKELLEQGTTNWQTVPAGISTASLRKMASAGLIELRQHGKRAIIRQLDVMVVDLEPWAARWQGGPLVVPLSDLEQQAYKAQMPVSQGSKLPEWRYRLTPEGERVRDIYRASRGKKVRWDRHQKTLD